MDRHRKADTDILLNTQLGRPKKSSLFSGPATKALPPSPHLSLVATNFFPECFFRASKNGLFSWWPSPYPPPTP